MGVLFHLSHDRQMQARVNVAPVLTPGALWLFTSGDQDGRVNGEMNGRTVPLWLNQRRRRPESVARKRLHAPRHPCGRRRQWRRRGAEGDVKHAVTASHKKRISTMFCLTS